MTELGPSPDADLDPARPWRRLGLPGGAEYGGPYGALVDSLAGFLDAVAEAVPPADEVEELSADLAGWTARLAPQSVPEHDRVFGRRKDLPGRGQTMSPRITYTSHGPDRCRATVRFGSYFLGGNQAAHGGSIPLVFDELLGHLVSHDEADGRSRPASRTAYLHTDFRAVTPIGPELELEAWLVGEEGRKRILRGALRHGDVLCAEAEALFVALRPGQP